MARDFTVKFCLAALLVGAVPTSATAVSTYESTPNDSGGIEVWLSTVDSGDGRTPFIQLVGRDALRDIKYAVLKTDDNGSSFIAEGEMSGIRTDEFKQVGGIRGEIAGRARFQACVSFLNLRSRKNHVVVSFFSENVATAAGSVRAGQAEEYAAPIRLVTDGAMTCEEALAHEFVTGFGHDDRFRLPAAQPYAAEEDDDLREGLFHIMTYAPSGREFRYDVEIGTRRSLADVEFRVSFAPAGGSGNSIGIGSRLGYLSPSYILQPRKMMGIQEYTDRLPANEIRIQACAAYFDVADQIYRKESWAVETSLAEQMASPEREDGRYHYPEEITWERSEAPLHC